MKIHKLIALLKEMETSLEIEGKLNETVPKLDQEEILNTLQFLQRCASAAGYFFTPQEPSGQKGTLHLQVTEETGGAKRPVVAQVKLWDNREHTIKTRFSLRRLVTQEDGSLSVVLPEGCYEAEISCGPEYNTCWVCFTVEHEKTVEAEAVIRRIWHLTDQGWMAGDLHHHSIYSSPAYGGTDPVIETPEEVCRSMKSLGMNFGALSDHHNVLNHDEWRLQDHAFTPIVSKEISTSNGHVLQLGVEEDVIYEIPKGSERTSERLRSEFIRICDRIRQQGGLPQVNHPFDLSYSTRYNSEFLDMIEIFQSIEIWNGATPFMEGTINGKAFHAWLSFLEEGKRLTATTGSDTHNIYGDDYYGMAEWLDWMISITTEHPEIFPKQIAEKADYLKQLYEQVWPRLLKWVERSNTPSDIHNYVYTAGKKSPEEILEAIRQGRNFVSNGPLLTVSVGGAGIGEQAYLNQGKGDLKIELFCREPIEHLWMYTGADRKTALPVSPRKTEYGYDYSAVLSDYHFEGASWAVFYADGGADNLAITNPVWIGSKAFEPSITNEGGAGV